MKGSMALRTGVAVAALLAAGAVFAQEPPAAAGGPGFGGHRPPMERALGGHGEHGKWWNNPTVVEKLKLTDDQRKAMDAIYLQHREKLIDLRANLEKSELKMEPLMSADQPNESAILAQIDEVAQTRAELEKANARFLLALRSKLTPDQWKQVQEFRASHEGMHRNWRPGGPRPGGPDGDNQAPPPPPAPGPQGMLDDGPLPVPAAPLPAE
jgi:periplasmic protein CpxP/Spy